MTDWYKLDNTFDEFEKRLTKKKLFTVYPELKKEFRSYRTILQKSSTFPNASFTDVFEIPITTGIKDDEYLLLWNITEILKGINAKRFPIKKVRVNSYDIHSCESRLDFQKLYRFRSMPKIESPIVLAHHRMIGKYIVIDGNHRYHTAIARKDTYINAVLLDPIDHINFMANDVSKHCYLVYHNLFVLQNLCFMPFIGKYKQCKSMGVRDYYPISNVDISFSKRKNLELQLRKLVG